MHEVETLEQENTRLREELDAMRLRIGWLESSSDIYRDYFKRSLDCIVVSRLSDGYLLDVNSRFEEMSGYSREELIGKTSDSLSAWTDPGSRKAFVETLKRQGHVKDYEMPFRTKDGRSEQALVSSFLHEVDGEPILMTSSDIITREVRQIRDINLFNQIFEYSGELIFISDHETGKFIYVNMTACMELGFSFEELSKKSVFDINTKVSDLDEWNALIKELQGDERTLFESSFRHKDGSILPVEVNIRTMRYRGIDYRIAMARNITKRKSVEEALEASERKYRTLVEEIPAITYRTTLDESYTVRYISPQVESLLESSLDEWYGDRRDWIKHVHPDDRRRVMEAFKHIQHSKESSVLEYRMLTHTGKTRWFRDESKVLKDEEGREESLQGVMYDISEQKLLEEVLRKRSREQGIIASLGQCVLEERSTDHIFEYVLNEISQVLAMEFTKILEWMPKEGSFSLRSGVGWGSEQMGTVTVTGSQESQAGFTLRSQGPVIIEDFQHEKRFTSSRLLREHDIRSGISIAIKGYGDSMFGILGVYSTKPRSFSEDDIDFMVSIANILGMAIEYKYEQKKLKSSNKELHELSAHRLVVREDERKHIAREIHDELGQLLTALKIDLTMLKRKRPTGDHLVQKSDALIKLTDLSIKTVRRISQDLRPLILDDLGLKPAMQWFAERYLTAASIRYVLTFENEDAIIDKVLATTLFRIYQETLTNIIRHSDASNVDTLLICTGPSVTLQIDDDGVGISDQQITDANSFGIKGMRERLHPWKGSLRIYEREGGGTTVIAAIADMVKE